MRRVLAAVAGVVVVLATTSCGSSEDTRSGTGVREGDNYGLSETVVTLKDGRKVVCIRDRYSPPRTISCDWEHAK